MVPNSPAYLYEGPLVGISAVPDTRKPAITTYPLPEILFVLLAAAISGCNSVREAETFGRSRLAWLREYYPYADGVPSHDTINRVLAIIAPRAFAAWFGTWVTATFGDAAADELLAVDGKRLAGSADRHAQYRKAADGGQTAKYVLNVLAVGSGIALGHLDISTKNSEVAGAGELLGGFAASLRLKGRCVSGDANFATRGLARVIVDGGGEYVFGLKGRNSILHAAARTAFALVNPVAVAAAEKPSVADASATSLPPPVEPFVTEEHGHGRRERREYRWLAIEAIAASEAEKYAGLRGVVEVTSYREETRGRAGETVERRYYMTTLDGPVAAIAAKIRAHWAIENSLHHVLDVEFGEDASRTRDRDAAVNLSVIRKVAMNFLSTGKSKAGIKHRRLKAALSDEYRTDVLNR